MGGRVEGSEGRREGGRVGGWVGGWEGSGRVGGWVVGGWVGRVGGGRMAVLAGSAPLIGQGGRGDRRQGPMNNRQVACASIGIDSARTFARVRARVHPFMHAVDGRLAQQAKKGDGAFRTAIIPSSPPQFLHLPRPP